MNRRDLLHSLPLLALTLEASAQAPTKQAPAQSPAEKAPYVQPTCNEPLLTECKAFPFEGLPVRYSDEGALTHQILEGQIPGSAIIEIHETTLEPGKMPHPPHRHPHAELVLVRSGTIEFISEYGGKAAPPVRITAGGMGYCAPDKLHGFHNIGDSQVTYFIVKIGNQSVCQK